MIVLMIVFHKIKLINIPDGTQRDKLSFNHRMKSVGLLFDTTRIDVYTDLWGNSVLI